MAIDVLAKGAMLKHSSIHDAESVLYILIWISCSQGGPHGQDRKDTFDPDTSFLRQWCPGEDLDESKLKTLANNKKVQMSDNEAFDEILDSMHRYFKDLKPYFKVLRNIFFPAQLSSTVDRVVPEPVMSIEDLRNVNMSKLLAAAEAEGATDDTPSLNEEKKDKKVEKTVRPLSDVIGQLKLQTLLFLHEIGKSEAKSKLREQSTARATVGNSASTSQDLEPSPTDNLKIISRQVNGMRLRNLKPPEGVSSQTRSNMPSSSRSTGKRSREQAFGSKEANKFKKNSTKRSKTSLDRNRGADAKPTTGESTE